MIDLPANVLRKPSHIILGAILGVAGCVTPEVSDNDAARHDMLDLVMPNHIEIVEPFTRVKSFDDDGTPDGIELLLQAVNFLDNPGLNIVGQVWIELFEYLPGSGDRKGRRLEHWDVELVTKPQQLQYWNALTQMYEFRLGINRDGIPRAKHFVLAVSYTSPLGDHLTDECVIRYPDDQP